MREKIEKLILENEKISLGKVAEELKVSLVEVLRNSPTVRKYPVEKRDKLFNILRGWEKVLLLVITPNFVLEIKDKFPQGFYGHGYLNFQDVNSSIGGHLSIEKIKEIFLVDDYMFGKKSCSIRFYDEDEKEVFAIYVPRDEKKELIKEYVDCFNSLI